MRETLAELLIRVPKSNCLGKPKARWCRDIWTSCAAVRWEMCSLTKDKATPVSKETSQLVSADWINIALDWPVAVYLLRAHQRQLANLRCKDPVSRLFPFPLHTASSRPDNKASQSIKQLFPLSFLSILAVISGGLSEHRWVKFYLTRQVS